MNKYFIVVWDATNPKIEKVSPDQTHLETLDGKVGFVEDFIIDDKTWDIRYLIVDTYDWWSGKRILVSSQWIKSVNWGDSTISLNLERELFRQLQEYNKESMLTCEYED